MPSAKSARRTYRQTLRNRPIRRRARTLITKAQQLIRGGDLELAEAGVKQAVSALDGAVTKGILHPNNAARRKSRLMKKLNQVKGSEGT